MVMFYAKIFIHVLFESISSNFGAIHSWNVLAAENCKTKQYKKSPANAKGNVRQRCVCEGPLRTKSKITTMFHLDSTADDA